MSRCPTPPILALTIGFAVACGDPSPTAVETPANGPAALDAEAAAVATVPDVSGDWYFERSVKLRMPADYILQVLNPMGGNNVVPEGPNTQAHCVGGGTMRLLQSGDTFAGTFTATWGYCATRGGQEFTGSGAGLPQQIFDGVIHGSSLSFSSGSIVVTPCPTQGVISEVEDGVATAFNAGGRCLIPGHPHSESVADLDPPPFGTQITRSFDAWR